PAVAVQVGLPGRRRARRRGNQPRRAPGRALAGRGTRPWGRPLVRRVRDPRLEDPALLHLPRPRLRRPRHRPLSLAGRRRSPGMSPEPPEPPGVLTYAALPRRVVF